jgi:hypothetical protein
MTRLRYITFLFIFLYQNSFSQNPIPVGFISIDEQVRNLQLLNKFDSNSSFSNRPVYTTNQISFDQLLNTIDPKLKYHSKQINTWKVNFRLLPVNLTQKMNPNRPFGWNDQALGFTKGYQSLLTTGLMADLGIFHAQYQPELVHYATGPFPKKTKLLPGQSFVGIKYAKLALSVSSENLWWGPGRYASLLMSNNAQGFEHLRLNTYKPIDIGIGKIEFSLVLGRMMRDTTFGFENNSLQKRGLNYSLPSTRQFNGVNVVYQPKILKNVFIGLSRSFQNYELSKPEYQANFNAYLPVLNDLFKNNYSDDSLNKDQILSLFTRWLFPKVNAEVYFEFGYNDAKTNIRDLLINSTHSSAYTFGFKKLQLLTDTKFLDLGFEATKMSQSPSYLQRSAGNWYEHGQVQEGFTNNNQIIGVGSGQGNDLQTITLNLREGFYTFGLKFQHIANQPYLETGDNTVQLRNTKWNDYVFGINWGHRYHKIIINANLEWVNAKNYNWIKGSHQGNLNAFINTIFLW